MSRNQKYQAFISYSHVDKKWAKWIHKALETYRIPRHLVGEETAVGRIPERLSPVFRDREDLPSAPDLTERIRDALESSNNLIVICSPNSAKSSYVDREIRMFRELGRGAHIFSIIVDGDPADVGGDFDCFCPALREQEPIAADARDEGDGKSLARLKVIAGLLGLGLDDLRQRELQRKQKRMAIITFASLAALAVTAILAVNAVIARNEADQRRQQAEDLLSFMVGDLYERLEPIGRLDVLEDVGAKAMDYYATVKASQLSDAELLHHAEVITQLGEIRLAQHQFGAALESFTEAYERSAEHYASDTSDGDRLFNRGQAEFWVGYVHWRRGALGQAKEWLTRYLRSSEEVAALDPDNSDWALEVVYAHHNLAVLALEVGDLDAAESGFQGEVRSMREIVQQDPSASNLQDLADAISWLGNIYLERGQLEESLEYYEETTSILTPVLEEDPGNAQKRRDLTHARQRMFTVTLLLGETDRAAEINAQALETFSALTTLDQGNLDWRRSLATATLERAQLLMAIIDSAGARASVLEAIEIYSTIESADDDVFFRTQQAEAYLLLAQLELADGQLDAASRAIANAVDGIEYVASSERLTHQRLGILVTILAVDGTVRLGNGDSKGAEEVWQRAAELLQEQTADSASPYIERARVSLTQARL